MKNILVLMHDDAGQEARFQAGLDLARVLGGHLQCLDVTLHPAVLADYYGVGGREMLAGDEAARERKNRQVFEARLAVEDVAWSWTDIAGNFVDAILDASTMSDIVVLNRQLDQFPYPDMRDTASRILMKSRVPLLAVPTGLRRLELGRALVAWDGRASCVSTLRSCVPLLGHSSTVELFTVRNGAEEIDADEAAIYLSRHGIGAEVRIVENGLHAADWHITTEIDRFRADFVLMGAYSHGRFIETFGGVTRRLLGHSKVPLLLAH